MGSRQVKSATAFRTISEVAAELNVPQHVLRFWETRFPQIRPLKRGGGRRYYRPEDVELLRVIQRLLYKDGYTIRGVQRLLREHRSDLLALSTEDLAGDGAEEIAAIGTPSDDDTGSQPEEPTPDLTAADSPGMEPVTPDTVVADTVTVDAVFVELAPPPPPPPAIAPAVRRELEELLDELRAMKTLLNTLY